MINKTLRPSVISAILLALMMHDTNVARADYNYLDVGVACYNNNHLNDALLYLQRELATNPGNPTALYYSALTYQKMNDLVQAKKFYQMLIRTAPQSELAAKANATLVQVFHVPSPQAQPVVQRPAPIPAQQPPTAPAAPVQYVNTGMYNIKQERFDLAKNYYLSEVKSAPEDAECLYYLGYSAMRTNDINLARRAFTKLLLLHGPFSQYGKMAAEFKSRLDLPNLTFRDPGQFSHKWHRRDMPLKVCVTDGLIPPYSCAGNNFVAKNVNAIDFHNPSIYKDLDGDSNFRESFPGSVEEAIRQWNGAMSKTFLTMRMEKNPYLANIIVFFVPAANNNGSCVFTKNQQVLIQICTASPNLAERKLVVGDEVSRRYFMAVMGREFGHALGLGNSNDSYNLMGRYLPAYNPVSGEGLPVLTENDSAALQALYDFE